VNKPTATYRVQLNRNFGFKELQAVVPYLAKLGISHIYASPIFQAKAGSTHGYDVLDARKISEELGGEAGFGELMQTVAAYGLGWIQDVVPNHVAYSPLNPMIADVLRKGSQSSFYGFFDVDWNHPAFKGRILAPFLEDNYEACLRRGEIKLAYDREFVASYKGLQLPLKRESYKEITKNSKSANAADNPNPLQATLEKYNSDHKLLDQLLSSQVFKLVNWQTVSQKLNYRRFFDIADLICLRMGNERVFEHIHQLIKQLIKKGCICGVRVDHIDGLHDPKKYIDRLRKELPDGIVIVEKILTGEEQLPASWNVNGTTGYEFINHINGIFVDPANERSFDDVYRQFTGSAAPFDTVVYECKKQIIETSFAADMDNLARLTLEAAKKRNYGQDCSFGGLREALVEVFAAFPIYRAYLSQRATGPKEQEPFLSALDKAENRISKLAPEFAVLRKMLAEVRQEDVLAVFMRLQQYTGVVLANGFVDTALYR
jgi:(1->4)-alpha-D-glucan 1-alpha-D-glucosylmutase